MDGAYLKQIILRFLKGKKYQILSRFEVAGKSIWRKSAGSKGTIYTVETLQRAPLVALKYLDENHYRKALKATGYSK
ncbi:MAG TPA: hypothetical protein VHR86_00245, partial [Armatimonadota bacterium]|nr:hypothetical protein [Armatimonadota bacterium]